MFQELTGNILNGNTAGEMITCGYYCTQFCQSECDDEYPRAQNQAFEYADIYSFIEG